MDEGIELHDSTLEAVAFDDTRAVVTLGPAYVHRAGCVWLQRAVLSFNDVVPSAGVAGLPKEISDGALQNATEVYQNLLPTHGVLAGDVTFSLLFTTGETWEVRARRAEIHLLGDASYLETLPANFS